MAGALAGGLSKPGPEWGRGPFFSAGVWGSPGGASGRAPPARAGGAGDLGQFLGQEDLPEKGMATHCSILVWTVPWIESGRLWSLGSQRVRHD